MSQTEVILAYDFGGTKVGAALADKNRRIIKKTRIKSSGVPVAVLLRRVVEMGNALLESVNDCMLVAVGVSMCGVVFKDHIELAPNLSGIEELNVRRMLIDAFHVRVVMENDVLAATLVELRRGNLKGTDYGLYVNFGTGIAAGFTAGNSIMRGHQGAAGEIGYLMKSRDDTATFKSGHASFEEFSSGAGVEKRFSEDYGRTRTAKEIFETSQSGTEIGKFVSEVCSEIGYQIANLAVMWNPEKIVIGGGMAASFAQLQGAILKKLHENVPYPPELVRSYFLQDASLYGAIELALSEEQ
ncbi:ROK family protein [Sporolactobacillus pectinivorans]|uniref:ROK family protein n=1 Tax=Sporolactobacillus pectinivorans TaxID=1591408 RepID=UPI000C26B163|nr:ROK family protein [Sporolactobacillus pectinivorans]